MTCFLINNQPPSLVPSPPPTVLQDRLGWGPGAARDCSATSGGRGAQEGPGRRPLVISLHMPQTFPVQDKELALTWPLTLGSM